MRHTVFIHHPELGTRVEVSQASVPAWEKVGWVVENEVQGGESDDTAVVQSEQDVASADDPQDEE